MNQVLTYALTANEYASAALTAALKADSAVTDILTQMDKVEPKKTENPSEIIVTLSDELVGAKLQAAIACTVLM